MPISITCKCGQSYNVREELAGKQVRCRLCKRVIDVPEAQPTSVELPIADNTLATYAIQTASTVPDTRSPSLPFDDAESPDKLRLRAVQLVAKLATLAGCGSLVAASVLYGIGFYNYTTDKAALEQKRGAHRSDREREFEDWLMNERFHRYGDARLIHDQIDSRYGRLGSELQSIDVEIKAQLSAIGEDYDRSRTLSLRLFVAGVIATLFACAMWHAAAPSELQPIRTP